MSAWKVEIKPHGEDFRVWLCVGPQSFIMSSNPAHDMEGAEWMAAQLRHAIEAIESAAYRRESKPPRCSALVYGGKRQCAQASRKTEGGKPYCGMHGAPSCSGCEPGSEGTHAEGTKEHP